MKLWYAWVWLSIFGCKSVSSIKDRLSESSISQVEETSMQEGPVELDTGVNTHGFQLVDTDYEKKLDVYHMGVRSKDNILQGVVRYMVGMDCHSKLKFIYSERQRDGKGFLRNVVEVKDYDFNFFAMGDLQRSSYLNRNLWNDHPQVDITLTLRCRDRTKKQGLPMYMVGGMDVIFKCSFGEEAFPKKPGEQISFICPTQKSYGLTLPTLKTLFMSMFEKFEFKVDLAFQSQKSLFDYGNCPPDVPKDEPFYIRISQGLVSPSNKDFQLSMRLDGQRIPKLAARPSHSGVYATAIAYCPKHTKDSIQLSFSGYEQSILRDEIFIPPMEIVSLKRGQRALYVLDAYRKKWRHTEKVPENTSQIMVEIFDQSKGAQKTMQAEAAALAQLSPRALKAQTKSHWQGNLYVQAQLFLIEARECFTYDKAVLGRFITESFTSRGLPFDPRVLAKMVQVEGSQPTPEELPTITPEEASEEGLHLGVETTVRQAVHFNTLMKADPGTAFMAGAIGVGVVGAVGLTTAAIVQRRQNTAFRSSYVNHQKYEACKNEQASRDNFHWILDRFAEQQQNMLKP